MRKKHPPTIIQASRADTELAEWQRERARPAPYQPPDPTPEPQPSRQTRPGKGRGIAVRRAAEISVPEGYVLLKHDEADTLLELAEEGAALYGLPKLGRKGESK